MNMSGFGDACPLKGALESLLQAAVGERMNVRTGLHTTDGCGKHPRLGTMRLPKIAE